MERAAGLDEGHTDLFRRRGRCLGTEVLGPISLREEFICATLGDLQATHLLAGERYLHLPQASLIVSVSAGAVKLSADAFARQVALSCEGGEGTEFSDNYFDLPPGASRVVRVIGKGGGEIAVSALNARAVAVTRAR
ncbi:MAG: hypothetical protein KAX44_05910 [Candidatus Brocadiae bacterium]|nr:hypothetical protein [Candidatus Brocadiia bacterium]